MRTISTMIAIVCLTTLPPILSASAQSEQATIFIFRPSAFSGWLRSTTVSVDGLAISELGSCSYAKLKIPAGVHEFGATINPWWGDKDETKKPLTLVTNLVAPEKYYVGYYPYPMAQEELKSTFTSFEKQEGSNSKYLGLVKPEVASKLLIGCDEVKAVYE